MFCQAVQVDSDDSVDAAPAKSKSSSKRQTKVPAKRGKKAEPMNTIEQALKKEAKPTKSKSKIKKILEDIEKLSSGESKSGKKLAPKRSDGDSDSPSISSVVSAKTFKPANKVRNRDILGPGKGIRCLVKFHQMWDIARFFQLGKFAGKFLFSVPVGI